MLRFVLTVSTLILTTGPAWANVNDLFPEKVKDFGVSPRGPVLVHYFRFTNTTDQPLNLGQPRVSCGCTSAAVTANKVNPGETAAVVAYMDTKKISTPYTLKSVTVYVPFFVNGTIEEASLRVQTVCRDDLIMSPDSLAFGTVKKGEGGKASTKVTLTSDPNWHVTEATSTGRFVKVEVREESRNGSMVTYEVTATLDKDCPAGNWVSDVNLKTSNPGIPQLRIPVTVNVQAQTGTGTDTVQLGEVTIGTSVEKRVTIQRSGPFKILQVRGADEQLAVTVETPDARPVQVITVSLKPTQAGAFARNLELVTDSKDQPRMVVPVVARVVP